MRSSDLSCFRRSWSSSHQTSTHPPSTIAILSHPSCSDHEWLVKHWQSSMGQFLSKFTSINGLEKKGQWGENPLCSRLHISWRINGCLFAFLLAIPINTLWNACCFSFLIICFICYFCLQTIQAFLSVQSSFYNHSTLFIQLYTTTLPCLNTHTI